MRDANIQPKNLKSSVYYTKKKKKQIKYIYFWIDLDWR